MADRQPSPETPPPPTSDEDNVQPPPEMINQHPRMYFTLRLGIDFPPQSILPDDPRFPPPSTPRSSDEETPEGSVQPSTPRSSDEEAPGVSVVENPKPEAPSSSATVGPKLKIFIVYFSMYGHVEALAESLKKAVDFVEGVEGVLYRVPETPVRNQTVPVITPEELTAADGVLFGFPTMYGAMAAQMKAFLDSTGVLWKEHKLAGKPAGFFLSTGTHGCGHESSA